MSAVTVEVTWDDIEHGVRGDCEECPVALALRRAFPTATFVRAGGIWLLVDDQGERFEADTPSQVMLFMGAFDREGTFKPKPFTFTVDFRKLKRF